MTNGSKDGKHLPDPIGDEGVIRAERVGRANVYRSLMSEKQCRGMEGSQFLKKVFRGEVAPLMLHFIENEPVRERYRGIEANARKERPSRWLIFSGHAGMFLSALVC